MSKENVDQVIKDISNKTENLVKTAVKTGQILNPVSTIGIGLSIQENNEDTKLMKEAVNPAIEKSMDTLKDIMAQGDKEFKERTGRQMTYAEMRAMYG